MAYGDTKYKPKEGWTPPQTITEQQEYNRSVQPYESWLKNQGLSTPSSETQREYQNLRGGGYLATGSSYQAPPAWAATGGTPTAGGGFDVNNLINQLTSGFNTSGDLSSLFGTVSEEQKTGVEEQVGRETKEQLGDISEAERVAIQQARERGRARTGAMRAGLGIQAEGMGGVDTASLGLIDATVKDMNKDLENIRGKYAAEKALLTSAERGVVEKRILEKQKSLDDAIKTKWDIIKNFVTTKKTLKETELLGQEDTERQTQLVKDDLSGTAKLIDTQTGEVIAEIEVGDPVNVETEMVYELISKYGDAGIQPTDTLQEAQAKLKNSRLYQQATRLAGGGTGGGGTTTPTTTDVMPTNINEAVDMAAQQLVEMRNNGRLNDLVYEQYLSGLMADWGVQEEQRGQVQSLLNQAMEGGGSIQDTDIGSDFETQQVSQFQTGGAQAGEKVGEGIGKVGKATGKFLKDFIPSLVALTGETSSYMTNFVRGIVGYKNEITEEEKQKVYRALGVIK